ncbi:MAG: Fic family protein [Acidimicrobiia bacterium]|nr:Fic family protein [Acidimicrobiia bacterium]
MARTVARHWEPRFEGAGRRDRQGCSYDAYVPDPLAGWQLEIPGDLAADVADAEMAIRDLNDTGTKHVSLEGLARFLLRAESVASSRIEGLDAGPRRLLDAETAIALGGDASDQVAVEILGNITAMETAVRYASQKTRFTLPDLLEVHAHLMESSRLAHLGGMIRTEQNWIGGSQYNPCTAAFVPPPPKAVPDLIDDLIDYVNADTHSPLVQAAVAHAQFETIHPFADGNGRTGRALIHVVLRRRELAPRFVPPVSLILATWATDYIRGLTDFRHLSPPGSTQRSRAAHTWLATFTTATRRACSDAIRYASDIENLEDTWRTQVGRIRGDSSLDRLLSVLPGAPIVTVASAAHLIDRSLVNTGAAINRLAEAGVVVQRNVGKQRYRVFHADGVLDLFTALERSLANPTGDTTTSPPGRPAPDRPKIR